MQHLVILSYSITLILGAWAAFSTRQRDRRRPSPCLPPLLQTIAFVNLMVLLYQAGQYVLVNLYGGDPSSLPPIGLAAFLLAAFAVEMGLALSILRLYGGLRLRGVSPLAGRIFRGAAAVLGLGYAVGIALLLSSGSHTWLRATHLTMAGFVAIVILGALMALVAGRHRAPPPARAAAARAFGGLYLAGFVLMLAAEALPGTWCTLLVACSLAWLNCAPLVWFAVWFDRLETALPPAGGSALGELAGRRNLTGREREVMALILQGKSNKEIEDLLCISFSTVKNHVYNLYRKLGVNSRAQLMHLALIDRPGSEGGVPVPADPAGS